MIGYIVVEISSVCQLKSQKNIWGCVDHIQKIDYMRMMFKLPHDLDLSLHFLTHA